MGVLRRCWHYLALAPSLLATGCSSMNLGATPPPLATTEAAMMNPIFPSNHRNWDANLVVLPFAEIVGDQVTLHNIRNTTYITETDFIVRHYDKTFNLSDVRSVDFCLVPFNESRALAHTFLSFGLADGTHFAISIEVRLENGEKYSPILGSLRQFEIMYLAVDERDVILLRTQHRDCDVFVYPMRATPAQSQAILTDMLKRINQLAKTPEFYDSITNNCTTNMLRHINNGMSANLHYDYRVLLPGYSAQLAYEAGLFDTELGYIETSRQARVTERANRNKDALDFSAKIREGASFKRPKP